MMKQRLFYGAALFGSVLFFICYQEWMSVLLLCVALLLPILSLLLSMPSMRRFSVSLRSEGAVTVGDTASAELVGEGELPYRGQLHLRRTVTGEIWHGREHVVIPTDHCGAVFVTAKRVRVYDRLGLIGIPVRCRAVRCVLVRPLSLPVSIPGDADKVLSSSWRPKAGGGFSEYHELRPYRPGDSLSRIHWKLTAKLGEPILREPMQPDLRWLISLDVRGTASEIDRLFGRLLYAGDRFSAQGIPFEIRAMTGGGLTRHIVMHPADLQTAIDSLLTASPVAEGSVRDYAAAGFRVMPIGGEPDET